MRALVTGSAGFIGSHLAEALLRDGVDVVGIDCFNDNYGRQQKLANLRFLTSWEAFEFVPVDLCLGELGDLVDGVDVVFHLAAEPGVRSSWGARYEKYLRNNLLASQHLLEALLPRPGVRLVFASSSSVYGDAATRPTAETAPLRPRSPYGQTKAAMEHLCLLYRANHGLDVVGLRYFTVFGPRQRPDMAFHRLIRASLEGTSFTMFGDGGQSRDFTYVDDVVAVTRAAAAAELGEERVFNIGGGSPATLREAIDVIEDLTGRPLRLEVAPSEHGDVRDTAADTTLARRWLGFDPRMDLRSGLTAHVEALRAALAAR
jgi:nucleoside-diphosphate-sugar epimerase